MRLLNRPDSSFDLLRIVLIKVQNVVIPFFDVSGIFEVTYRSYKGSKRGSSLDSWLTSIVTYRSYKGSKRNSDPPFFNCFAIWLRIVLIKVQNPQAALLDPSAIRVTYRSYKGSKRV